VGKIEQPKVSVTSNSNTHTVYIPLKALETEEQPIKVGHFQLTVAIPFFHTVEMVETYCEEKGWSIIRFLYEWEKVQQRTK